MKKVIRLTESDLVSIVKRIIKENDMDSFLQLNNGDMVLSQNNLFGSERPKKMTKKDYAILELKSALMQINIWSKQVDPSDITEEDKEMIKDFTEGKIESAFLWLEEGGYEHEDFSMFEEMSDKLRNYCYNLFNID